jgi:hypothetical protein
MNTNTENSLVSPTTILTMFVSAKLLDLLTTYICITLNYGYEVNPVSAFFLNTGGWTMLSIFGLSAVILQGIFFCWYQKFLARRNNSITPLLLCRIGIFLSFFVTMIAVINNSIIIITSIA